MEKSGCVQSAALPVEMATLPLDGASEDLVSHAALLLAEMMLLEAPGEYVYDTVEEKRLVLGDGGRSGNCEYCVDAADRGWIADDDVFEGPMGDEDGPPLHPHCACTLEYRTRRFRVAA